MSSTINAQLRPHDKKHDPHVRQRYLAGDAPDAAGEIHYWRRNVRIGDFTAAAAVTDEVDLFADLTAVARARKGQSGDFPADVWVNIAGGPYLRTIVDWSGGGAASVTIEFGDTGDTNGLLTATSVFTGVGASVVWTPAAVEYDRRHEPAFAPVILITCDINVDQLTAGESEIVIPYTFHPRDL